MYEALRDELLSGAVSPFDRVTEERVADRFGVSRTPVRAALGRLLSDGLLVRRDGVLYRYLPSLHELTEQYELRLTLERRGIERAAQVPGAGHDRAALEAEVDLWRRRRRDGVAPDAGFVTADEQFHVTLLRAAGNAELAAALIAVNRRIRAVRMHDYLTQDRVDATVAEHVAIGELVLGGHLPEALEALETHVGRSHAVVEARAARALHLSSLPHPTEVPR
ncbi:GntR family transcriptional regulator [Georgenia daeguensis]|uniref:GntR family transcriptional regulator n=1 Tax=Georgenia daeguensis TaxID=908355 RepID=A0ABP8ESC6_9MICO